MRTREFTALAALCAVSFATTAAVAETGAISPEAQQVAAVTAARPPDAADNFSNPASGWSVVDAGIRHQGYRDGAYHIALDGTGEGWVLGTDNRRVGNAILQVDATEAKGSDGHPYGVFVRAQSDQNFFAVVVSSDGSFAAFHVKDGQLAIDGPANASLPAGLFKQGAANRIQVYLQDATIVYLLNGREIARATALWPTGVAGVLSASVRPGKTDVIFDDWKMWNATAAAKPAAGALTNDVDKTPNPAALGGGF
jgi:hypothetical protein